MGVIHRKLDTKRRQVRLLRMKHFTSERLDDGWESDLPTFDLAVFTLDNIPKYKALSYCWGKEEATHPIEINKNRLFVRPNLHAFLEHWSQHRYSTDTDWIFIDAICINQQDVDERSGQVALMGDIYRGANEVIAWLGNDGDVERDFTRAEVPLHRFHTDPESWQWVFDQFGVGRAFNAARRLVQDADDGVVDGFGFEEIAVQSLVLPLVHRSFWYRLWVVQEMVLANRLTIWYKTLRVPWDVLYGCLKYGWSKPLQVRDGIGKGIRLFGLSSTKYDLSADSSAFHVYFLLQDKLASDAESGRMLLSTAVMSFGKQECSNTVDKVYGLLGMTASVLTPDYNETLFVVYHQALIEGMLEILYKYPNGKGAAEELTLFVVHLARALGQDLSDDCSKCFIVTKACMKYIGLPITNVSKLWHQTHHLNYAQFNKFGLPGKKVYKMLPTLLHFKATWYDTLEETFHKVTGTTSGDDREIDSGVEKEFKSIQHERSFERWRFNALAKAVPQLPALTSDRAESMLQSIVTFQDSEKSVELATQAIVHIEIELSKAQSSQDPMAQDHSRRLEGYMNTLRTHIVASSPQSSSRRQDLNENEAASVAYIRTPKGAEDVDTVAQFLADRNFFTKVRGLTEDNDARYVVVHMLFKALWKNRDEPRMRDVLKAREHDADFAQILGREGYKAQPTQDDMKTVVDEALGSIRGLIDELEKPIVLKGEEG